MILSDIQTVTHALMLALVAGTPLCMAFFCCTPLTRQVARFLPLATLPAFIVSLTAPLDVHVEVPWFFMGSSMGLDEPGRIFLCLSAFIWLLSCFSSRTLLRSERNQARYLLFLLAAMAGNFGLILARGMLGYYLFFALMSFAAYGLVVHKESDNSRKAGRLYLLLVMIGEVALFSALVILANDSGSLAIEDIGAAGSHLLPLLLLFIGFGVKIGALPLHGWMIPAYQATPPPAAAALAGSMVNAGLLGWLRFLPPGQAMHQQGASIFIGMGAVAAIYGVLAGLGRKGVGAVLGASSISQMGLMTVIFGLGLVNQDGGILASSPLILYVVHHSLAKSSLFFGYNLAERKKQTLSCLEKTAVALPALALAGLPLTSGAIAKTAFKGLATGLGEPWYGLSSFFFPITAMGTTLLMLHFLALIGRSKGSGKPGTGEDRIVFAASVTAVAATLWLWPAAGDPAARSLTGEVLFQTLWPIVSGWILFLVWKRVAIRLNLSAGEQETEGGFDKALKSIVKIVEGREPLPPEGEKDFIPMQRIEPQLRRTEKILGRWNVVGLSYIALCLCLLFLLLFPLF